MTYFRCGGPFSAPTGWAFSVDVRYCGRCAREFYAWFRDRMARMSRPWSKRKGDGACFALEVTTSIGAARTHGEVVP